MKLQNIEPAEVFRFFEEISAIPRGSENTDGITDYLVTFAEERGLEYIRDPHNNVIIKKGAQGNCENNEPVIIQGHTDMVTVAAPGKEIDFINEPIELIVEGDYIHANGTTLGADDGVAVVYALAVLDNKELTHPPIEAVFTSDEEIGLLGAGFLDASHLSGKTFLNIDSEDDGIIFAGCAGGATCNISRSLAHEKTSGAVVQISLSKLTGGHSGMEIDKHRANACKIAAAALKEFSLSEDFRLISFEGGDKENAIAPWVSANIILDAGCDGKSISDDICNIIQEKLSAYKDTDPEAQFNVNVSETEDVLEAITENDTKIILRFLAGIEDGALKMSEDLEGVVETSSNLGIVRIGKECDITASVRSIITPERDAQIERIRKLAGDDFSVNVSGKYSAWSYSKESRARDILLEEYKKITGKDAEVRVIHAGLECGIFSEKMPDTDFVSFGPQADDIHTYNERLSISSTARYWEILKNTLERLAKIKR